MFNSSWDSEIYDLATSYNASLAELSDIPHYSSGSNMYVTAGGKLSRRPGTTLRVNGNFNLRIDRAWLYEAVFLGAGGPPQNTYAIVSAFNSISGFWELWYSRYQNGDPLGWAQVPSYRDINLSTAPHTASISRNLMYVKGIPASGSSEKLGTVILDGATGTIVVKPWGILGPTTSAFIGAASGPVLIALNTNALTPTTTGITLGTIGFDSFATITLPVVVQIDYEQMNVTSITTVGAHVTGLVVTRGYNGTAAASHPSGSKIIYRPWTASGHTVTVNIGWQYSYGYKTITGQYSNRAPFQTDPDVAASDTGPFFNQIPKITVQGLGDTTNIPKIAIYRTTDGGSTPYLLTEITNTGVGPIVFTDNGLTSTYMGSDDPTPDSLLDTTQPAPSLVSNSPPPTVLAPLVTGTNTPSVNSPITTFRARHWYAIGNVLFYSANEEIILGIPEECFPSGAFGNFFRFEQPITNVIATGQMLYIFTTNSVYAITGTTRDTFASEKLFDNYGHPFGHSRAVTAFAETVAFLTHDYRIAVINGTSIEIISDPLYFDIVTAIVNNGAEIDIKYFGDIDKEWLMVAASVPTNTSLNRQWVLDIKRTNLGRSARHPMPYFWSVPWTIPSIAMLSGRINELSSRRWLMFFMWNGTTGRWSTMDSSGVTATDYLVAGVTNFDCSAVSSLRRNPIGNHINEKRLPGLTTVAYSLQYDRTKFTSDTDPTFNYYLDDIWTTPLTPYGPNAPARRNQSKGYLSFEYPIYNVCQRIAWKFAKTNSSDRFEIQEVRLVFAPDSGT